MYDLEKGFPDTQEIQCLSYPSPLAHSPAAQLTSLLFLEHTKCAVTSVLYLPFPWFAMLCPHVASGPVPSSPSGLSHLSPHQWGTPWPYQPNTIAIQPQHYLISGCILILCTFIIYQTIYRVASLTSVYWVPICDDQKKLQALPNVSRVKIALSLFYLFTF